MNPNSEAVGTVPERALAPDDGAANARAERFLVHVLWTWLGVAASFITGFFLSPYIIRKLGDQRYGIWALTFAFIEYLMLFDLGFRSAIVNFASRFRTQGEAGKVNEVINTALAYFVGAAAMVVTAVYAVSGRVHEMFQITPAYQEDFSTLVSIVGVSWAAAMVFNIFQAAMEAFQQFKTQNRIYILTMVVRSGGCVALLYFGYGIVAMGLMVVWAQILGYALTLWQFRRVFPELRFSRKLVSRQQWKDMAGFGMHSVVAGVGMLLANQGPPVLVGHFLPEAFVGYYTLPSRVLTYVAEMITRIGFITVPNTAELKALGKDTEIAHLGMYLNRYCFAVFMPLTIFLLVCGREFIERWVGAAFAVQSAPLLLPFVLWTAVGLAGQFNSSSILYGIAKHNAFAKALMVEAVVTLLGIVVVIPRYGILGVAWVVCGMGIANRAVFVPALLCRLLRFSLFRYLRSIYVGPLIVAAPVMLVAYWCKAAYVRAGNWPELFAMLGMIGGLYYGIYLFTGMEREHRAMLWGWIGQRLPGRSVS